MVEATMKIDREMSPHVYHLLRKLGLNQEEMEIVHDLSVHAAEKAAEHIFMVALTSPRVDMINLITLTSAMILGQSASKLKNESAEQLAALMRGEIPEGVRVFDGAFATR